eukprot:PhM_4_TR479/c0_g1_i2/m.96029
MSRGTRDILAANRGLAIGAGMNYNAAAPPPPSTNMVGAGRRVGQQPNSGGAGLRQPQPQQQQQQRVQRSTSLPYNDDGTTTEPPPEKLDHYIHILKDKLAKQKSDLDARTDNVNAIQRNFERLSEMYSTDRDKLNAAVRELEAARAELEDLRSQNKVGLVCRAELQNLQQKIEKSEALHSAESNAQGQEILALRKAREALADENRKLSERLSGLDSSVVELRAMEAHTHEELTTCERSCNALLDQVLLLHQSLELGQNVRGEGIAFVRRDVNGESASTHLNAASRVMTIKNALAMAATRAVPPVLTRLEMNKTQMAKSNATQQCDLDKLRRENAQTAAALHDARQRVEELERLLGEAGHKLHETQMTVAQRAQSEATELRNMKDRVAEMQREAKEHTDALAAEQLKLSETVAAHDVQRRAYDEERAGFERELKHKDMTAESLRTSLQERQTELEVLRQEAAHYRSQCERVQKDTANRSATEQAQMLQRQREWEDQVKVAAQREAQRRRERDEEAARVAEVTAELTQLRERLDAATAAHAALQETNTEFAARVGDAERALTVSQNEADAWRHKHDEAVRALSDASQALSTHSSEWSALERERADLAATVSKLTKALSDAEELARAQKNVAEKESVRASQYESQLNTAKMNLEQRDKEIASLRLQKDELFVKLHIAEQKVETHMSEESRVKRQLEDWQEERSRMMAAHEQNERAVATLRTMQQESLRTVKKLIAAEEACESGYSCMSCLGVMKDPVLCSPCGHSYCRECLKQCFSKHGDKFCVECDMHNVTAVVPSRALDLLSGKYSYKKQVLNDLMSVLVSQNTRRGSLVE